MIRRHPWRRTLPVGLILVAACATAAGCGDDVGSPAPEKQNLTAWDVFRYTVYGTATDSISLSGPMNELGPSYIKLRWALSSGAADFDVAYTGPDSAARLVRIQDAAGWHDSRLGDWEPTLTGRFVFRAIMDPENAIAETNEEDNEDSLVLWVIP